MLDCGRNRYWAGHGLPRGVEVEGSPQTPTSLTSSVLFECGLGDVAPDMAWVVMRSGEKTLTPQLSSHVWDAAISRRGVSVSCSPITPLTGRELAQAVAVEQAPGAPPNTGWSLLSLF